MELGSFCASPCSADNRPAATFRTTSSKRLRINSHVKSCHSKFYPRGNVSLSALTFDGQRLRLAVTLKRAFEKKGTRSRCSAAIVDFEPDCLKVAIGDREVTLETGEVGRQAGGAVFIRDGDTMVYVTACAGSEPAGDSSFVPLNVQYNERMSAAGRTSATYLRRDGRPGNSQILVSRLIDRPLRPMFEKGWNKETQVICEVYSYDGVQRPEPLAITAAGAALVLSDIPLKKAVAGVRVGRLEGQLLINPTVQQMEGSDLDLVLAGTSDAVLMIEGFCTFLSDEEMLQAIAFGAEAVSHVCKAIEEWGRRRGKPKRLERVLAPLGLQQLIAAKAEADIERAYRTINGKQERAEALAGIRTRIKEELLGDSPGVPAEPGLGEATGVATPSVEASPTDAEAWKRVQSVPLVEDTTLDQKDMAIDGSTFSMAYKEVESGVFRRLVLQEGIRSDGRGLDEVRPIRARADLLPRTHGSALFTRGETQVIATTTLGSQSSAQRMDGLTDEEDLRKFYLQYFFPPSCVGEAGRYGVPSRREIGHGALAERALLPIIPQEDEFPYTIRVESTVTESNGSSSMASVCGGCLALMDAGVPVKRPVAGVAMGLILEPSGEFKVLTDILGSEDALGDMDFKVAGDADSITAFQMDIKVEGITVEVLREALSKARKGIRHILGEMQRCSPAPRQTISKWAPSILRFYVDVGKIGLVIGVQGRTIKALMAESGANIQIDQATGLVEITGDDSEAVEKAKAKILAICEEPEEGKIYRQVPVTGQEKFGVYAEFIPTRTGLVHSSELGLGKTAKPEDFEIGSKIDVKLLEIGENSRFRLSRKAVLMEDEGIEPEPEAPPPQMGDVFRDCKVVEQMAFGVVVEFQNGMTGLVHVSELETGRAEVTDYEIGSTMDVMVTEVIGNKLRLSRKALLVPAGDFPTPQVGDIVRAAPVVRSAMNGVTVQLNPGYTAFVKKEEMDMVAVRKPGGYAQALGNVLDVEVVEVDGSKVFASRRLVLLKDKQEKSTTSDEPASNGQEPLLSSLEDGEDVAMPGTPRRTTEPPVSSMRIRAPG